MEIASIHFGTSTTFPENEPAATVTFKNGDFDFVAHSKLTEYVARHTVAASAY